MTNLTDPIFTDADAARRHLEAQRWPDGPNCPHCGNADPARIRTLAGKAHRPGVYQCNECREQFTVTVGTVFERSKIPLNKWVLATHLMAASKKGMSAHQLHRMLGVTYKTAWFMAHRIREAMKDTSTEPMGGPGSIIEADETYYGRTDAARIYKTKRNRAVVGLVERGGKARMFHVKSANATNVREILVRNASRKSELHTDESRLYTKLGEEFAGHRTVTHSQGEYAREGVHTNSIEGYFSVFKRGMRGVYQHCGEAHLQRYLNEFSFRFNHRTALGVSDVERRDAALKGAEGKRLTYRRSHGAALA
jgi:transposase-like protein